MEWSWLQDNLRLSAPVEVRVKSILTDLQQDFFDLCSSTSGNGKSIIEQLSDYLAEGNHEPQLVQQHLISLLQSEEQDGRTKFELLVEMEEYSREQIYSQLSIMQADRFESLAPESLLDIEVANNPFSAFVQTKINGTPPPGFVCRSPFEYVHVQANGDVYPCCPSKFGKIIGNLTKQGITEIWNSPEAQLVRDSIENGDYRYCNAHACEYLRRAEAEGTELSPQPLVQWLSNKGLLNAGRTPKIVNLGSDKTCNLACSYCRKELFKLTDEERTRITLIDQNTFEQLTDDTERIVLLGEGDPFASPIYLDKLRNYDWSKHKKLKLKIQTNGLLLTPSMWESIHHSHPVIDWIAVSVDGATPYTYKLNRGGDFNKLVQNLEFISTLRREGQIRKFWINFLVQANNYREMPEFAMLGKRLGCDLIEFQRIENWGTFTEEEYRERAVHEYWHEKHDDLLRVLAHPVLQTEGIWLLKLSEHLNQSVQMNVLNWDE